MPFNDDIGIPYIDQSARVLSDMEIPSRINNRLLDADILAVQFRDPYCDLPFEPSHHAAHR
jgi:hypothetical protein